MTTNTLIDRLCIHADAAMKTDWHGKLAADINEAISVLRRVPGEIPVKTQKAVLSALCNERERFKNLSVEWDVADVMMVIEPYLRRESVAPKFLSGFIEATRTKSILRWKKA